MTRVIKPIVGTKKIPNRGVPSAGVMMSRAALLGEPVNATKHANQRLRRGVVLGAVRMLMLSIVLQHRNVRNAEVLAAHGLRLTKPGASVIDHAACAGDRAAA